MNSEPLKGKIYKKALGEEGDYLGDCFKCKDVCSAVKGYRQEIIDDASDTMSIGDILAKLNKWFADCVEEESITKKIKEEEAEVWKKGARLIELRKSNVVEEGK